MAGMTIVGAILVLQRTGMAVEMVTVVVVVATLLVTTVVRPLLLLGTTEGTIRPLGGHLVTLTTIEALLVLHLRVLLHLLATSLVVARLRRMDLRMFRHILLLVVTVVLLLLLLVTLMTAMTDVHLLLLSGTVGMVDTQAPSRGRGARHPPYSRPVDGMIMREVLPGMLSLFRR
jgi:hypothetical protein